MAAWSRRSHCHSSGFREGNWYKQDSARSPWTSILSREQRTVVSQCKPTLEVCQQRTMLSFLWRTRSPPPLLPSLPPSTARKIFLSSFSPAFTFALPSVWPCSDRWRQEALLPPPCVHSPVLWGLKDPKKPAAMFVTEAKQDRVFQSLDQI